MIGSVDTWKFSPWRNRKLWQTQAYGRAPPGPDADTKETEVKTKTTFLAAALAASGALALLLAASAAPPPAEAKSWREQWRQQAAGKHARQPRRKGFAWRLDPRLYHWQPRGHFGVGPGSYECFGYDCNW